MVTDNDNSIEEFDETESEDIPEDKTESGSCGDLSEVG